MAGNGVRYGEHGNWLCVSSTNNRQRQRRIHETFMTPPETESGGHGLGGAAKFETTGRNTQAQMGTKIPELNESMMVANRIEFAGRL